MAVEALQPASAEALGAAARLPRTGVSLNDARAASEASSGQEHQSFCDYDRTETTTASKASCSPKRMAAPRLRSLLPRLFPGLRATRNTANEILDAVTRNDIELVASLLLDQRGLKAAVRSGPGPAHYNACHIAARLGHAEVLRQVLFKLSVAEKTGRIPRCTVQLFVNCREGETRLTPLMLACKEGHANVVAALLEYGADPMSRARHGNMALHLAAARGHEDCIEALLSRSRFCVDRIWRDMGQLRAHGRKLADMYNVHGITPLHLAAFHDHGQAMLTLLAFKARTHYTTAIPVRIATLRAAPSPNCSLLNGGADLGPTLDAELEASSTAMHCAVAGGACEAVRVLLAAQVEGLGTLRRPPRDLAAMPTRRERGVDLRRFSDALGQSPEILAVSTQGISEETRAELLHLTHAGNAASSMLGDWAQARIIGPPPLAHIALEVHRASLKRQIDAAAAPTTTTPAASPQTPFAAVPLLPPLVRGDSAAAMPTKPAHACDSTQHACPAGGDAHSHTADSPRECTAHAPPAPAPAPHARSACTTLPDLPGSCSGLLPPLRRSTSSPRTAHSRTCATLNLAAHGQCNDTACLDALPSLRSRYERATGDAPSCSASGDAPSSSASGDVPSSSASDSGSSCAQHAHSPAEHAHSACAALPRTLSGVSSLTSPGEGSAASSVVGEGDGEETAALGEVRSSGGASAELEECAICMDGDASVAVRTCGHAYCAPCLRQLMADREQGAPLCPMCRAPIDALVRVHGARR